VQVDVDREAHCPNLTLTSRHRTGFGRICSARQIVLHAQPSGHGHAIETAVAIIELHLGSHRCYIASAFTLSGPIAPLYTRLQASDIMSSTAAPPEGSAQAPIEPYGVDRDSWDHGACSGAAPDLHLTVVVLGATGDLAEKKTIPALESLYTRGCVRVFVAFYGQSSRLVCTAGSPAPQHQQSACTALHAALHALRPHGVATATYIRILGTSRARQGLYQALTLSRHMMRWSSQRGMHVQS
jgi:Glucose-6-phosphate dehydrogenase, NAD binding domain